MSEEARPVAGGWASIGRVQQLERAGAWVEAGSPEEITITLTQRGIVWSLSSVAAVIVLLHVVVTLVRSYADRPIVGIDNLYTVFGLWAESSLANWYSSTLFLLAAALLALITVATRARRDADARYWAGLGLVFLALAIDDAADVHGQLSYVLHAYLQTTGFLLYAWIIPATALLALFVLAFARFVWNLPAPVRTRFVLAGVIFCVSALVFEAFEGRHDGLYGTETMTYKLLVTIEESAEMAAIILFIATLFGILRALGPQVRMRLR